MLYIFFTLLAMPFLVLLRWGRQPAQGGRILIVQMGKIGDTVCALPVFREVRRAYPSAHLALLTTPVGQQTVQGNPYLSEIIVREAAEFRGWWGKYRMAALLRGKRFDTALFLTPNVPQVIVSTWAVIPRRFSLLPDLSGITYRLAAFLTTACVPHRAGESLGAAYQRLLQVAGLPDPQMRREIPVSVAARVEVDRFLSRTGVQPSERLIGLAPASGNKLKEWPAERFAQLADSLVERYGARIVLLGGAADREVSMRVQEIMRYKAVDACGVFTLQTFPALLERLSLFVGADSGPLYMAQALGVPCVVIAGPCSLTERDLAPSTIVVEKPLPCFPCVFAFSTPYTCRMGHHRCIHETEVAEVAQAAERLLAGRPVAPEVLRGGVPKHA